MSIMRYPLWKRSCDITGGALGFFLMCVLFPFISLAIIIEDGFPVFVKLDRVSEGKIIKVWKFRTMVRGAHEKKKELEKMNERSDGPLFKIRHDPRVTRAGRVLRRLRVDEMPQFINVLLGEMALVGPRPHEPGEVEKYPEEYKKITFARAGITGLSQVSGASSLAFQKELELDAHYTEHTSFFLDIKIIFKTIKILFFDPTGV